MRKIRPHDEIVKEYATFMAGEYTVKDYTDDHGPITEEGEYERWLEIRAEVDVDWAYAAHHERVAATGDCYGCIVCS